MERRLSLHARREVIHHQRQPYHEADQATKHAILDEICALTSYHRVYARWLLNHPEAAQPVEIRVVLQKFLSPSKQSVEQQQQERF